MLSKYFHQDMKLSHCIMEKLRVRPGEGSEAESSAKAESLTFIMEHEPWVSQNVVLMIPEESWSQELRVYNPDHKLSLSPRTPSEK